MKQLWTEADFATMSWHDCAVHGLRLIEGGDGCSGDFVLDIDYIMEWLPPTESRKSYEFRIAPAELTFHETTELKIALDYAAASAAFGPFAIHQLAFVPTIYGVDAQSRRWKIELNWPVGEITFVSPRLTQTLVGQSTVANRQSLSPDERAKLTFRL